VNTFQVALIMDGKQESLIVDNAHSAGDAESLALALLDGADVLWSLYMGATSDQTLLMGVG
jgi:hypothetical protein